jgi:hypothetical protein
VLNRLAADLVKAGFCAPDPRIRLCLAAGKFYGDVQQLRAHFDSHGWTLWGPDWLKGELSKLADSGYENSVASVVAKLLLRVRPQESARVSDSPTESGAEIDARNYEHIPDDMRDVVLTAAYYLSRFQHNQLGLGNQDQTLEQLADRLHVKKNTLKNYRDRFDPHTGSGRRGWWQATLSPELKGVIDRLQGCSEEQVREMVMQWLNHAGNEAIEEI